MREEEWELAAARGAAGAAGSAAGTAGGPQLLEGGGWEWTSRWVGGWWGGWPGAEDELRSSRAPGSSRMPKPPACPSTHPVRAASSSGCLVRQGTARPGWRRAQRSSCPAPQPAATPAHLLRCRLPASSPPQAPPQTRSTRSTAQTLRAGSTLCCAARRHTRTPASRAAPSATGAGGCKGVGAALQTWRRLLRWSGWAGPGPARPAASTSRPAACPPAPLPAGTSRSTRRSSPRSGWRATRPPPETPAALLSLWLGLAERPPEPRTAFCPSYVALPQDPHPHIPCRLMNWPSEPFCACRRIPGAAPLLACHSREQRAVKRGSRVERT